MFRQYIMLEGFMVDVPVSLEDGKCLATIRKDKNAVLNSELFKGCDVIPVLLSGVQAHWCKRFAHKGMRVRVTCYRSRGEKSPGVLAVGKNVEFLPARREVMA